ncbi:MAG: hypothetical protein HY706_15560 [Candidatus Hydrogenedentes bacterium]|nr:hypothetical protein [Candidatus Hydrogenedentota bacterium]
MTGVRHPFQRLSPAQRRIVFCGFLAATLIMSVVLKVQGRSLRTSAAPLGILSFEFAGTPAKARMIIESWADVRFVACWNLFLDFPYLVFYSTTIGLACVWAGEKTQSRGRTLASFGIWLAWGQWLAGGLDTIENAALLLILRGFIGAPWPQLAWSCALVKFSIIALGTVYVILGCFSRHLGR